MSHLNSQDHPRSCGKNLGTTTPSLGIRGSPPLVRERLVSSYCLLYASGITPARAGKTLLPSACTAVGQDHPRSCGKDDGYWHVNPSLSGSPPLVRERPSICTAGPWYIGITPARAGKTRIVERWVGLCRDHPRSCEKDAASHSRSPKSAGSPPLVRERLLRILVAPGLPGITPARAGKTQIPGHTIHAAWDHPRSCGKDMNCFPRRQKHRGSPPLVRERQCHYSQIRRSNRITPARAGKTSLLRHIHGAR